MKHPSLVMPSSTLSPNKAQGNSFSLMLNENLIHSSSMSYLQNLFTLLWLVVITRYCSRPYLNPPLICLTYYLNSSQTKEQYSPWILEGSPFWYRTWMALICPFLWGRIWISFILLLKEWWFHLNPFYVLYPRSSIRGYLTVIFASCSVVPVGFYYSLLILLS